MAETTAHLKQKIASLEAEVKRLNNLIEHRYKDKATAIPDSELSSGQVLAIKKLKGQNERLTKSLQKREETIRELTAPKRKRSSSGTSQKKSFQERTHSFNQTAPNGKKLTLKIYGATFQSKPSTEFQVGDKVQTLSGRTTSRGKVPSILNGVIVKKTTTHCQVQTDKFGVWRSPFYALRKR